MSVISHATFIFFGYWVASIIEWMIHNLCMHAANNDLVPLKAFKDINRQHIIHHNATKTDMTCVPTVNKYKKHKLSMKWQRFQGLYFVWPVCTIIIVGGIVGGPVVNLILSSIGSKLGYDMSYGTTSLYGLALTLYMCIMWNYVHPTLHYQPGLSLNEGLDLLPRYDWMLNTFWYRWLWRNHVLHHFLKGKNAGNYNVTLPGGDWLMGTYHSHVPGYTLDMDTKKISYKAPKKQ
eukprot:276545_1